MVETIITISGTLSGVVVGFVLSKYSLRQKESNKSEKLRGLLKLELMQNLHLLGTFWRKFQMEAYQEDRGVFGEDISDAYEMLAFRQAHKFIETPLPQWNRKVWESHFSSVGSVLDDHEILQVWRFYDDLERISALHTMLSSYKTEFDKAAPDTPLQETDPVFFSIITSFANEGEFQEEALDLWCECEQTINNLLKTGNPVV